MARDSFPEGVTEKLKWYVYRLIDPRNGETFYVGKGRGNRVFAHASGQTPSEEIKDGELGPKLERIREIKASGLEVGHIIHRHGLSTADRAFEVEAALIDAYPGLSNQVVGVGSRVRGSRHVEEIIIEYAAEEFQVKEPLMMISIGVSYYERNDPYDAVRYAWQVNVHRARQYNLVLARLRGLIVGAYRPEKWLPATRENFPDLAQMYNLNDAPGRHGFVGKPACDEGGKYYVWKRVPGRFLGSQSAVRYLRPEGS